MFKILSTCRGGGYMYCRTEPPHPRRNTKGLYPLHRVLMEIKLNRLLLPGEEVHHVDEDKTNNAVDNLEVKTKSEHSQHHAAKKTLPLLSITCKCGKVFKIKACIHRLRVNRNSSKQIYCSRSCAVTFTRHS